MKQITPQEGFQKKFLSTKADIIIGGGSAGAGKTFALLMESLRHIQHRGFNASIFRTTYPQIKNPGGLWDSSNELYRYCGGKPNESNLKWTFPSGASIKFNHLQYDKNVYDYQGAEIPFIAFDELTHFSEKQFFYLLSRNRSMTGIKPYVRATCNPDPDSWVARFIDWWIGEDGYPIPERDGVVRYFAKDDKTYIWGSTPDEVKKKAPYLFEKGIEPKSATYIFGDIYGNQELLKVNPEYLGNLLAQDEQTKLQLLKGNWKVKTDGTQLIDYDKIKDCFTNTFIQPGKPYLSCDIALEGSDKLVLCEWLGDVVTKVHVIEKSNAKEVLNLIEKIANDKQIPRSQIIFDNDGVGAFLSGFLKGAKPFNNNGTPKKLKGRVQNYQNLKAQCYYKLAEKINEGLIYIADSKYQEEIIRQSRVILRHKKDVDGKLQIVPKEKMKSTLGYSPDILDALMMKMYYEYSASFDF